MAFRSPRQEEEDERGRGRDEESGDEQRNPFPGGGPPSQSGATSGDERRRGTALGVPRGYTTQIARRDSPNWQYPYVLSRPLVPGLGGERDYEQGPRYYDGDQYRPASEPMDSIIEKQRLMVIAGLLDPAGVNLGVWDAKTVAGYEALLEYANRAGLTADQALRRFAESPGQFAGGGGEGGGGGGGGFTIDPETGEIIPFEETFVAPPLEVQTTNKDDLRRVFRAAVINMLGRGWSDAQINELVDSYNWKEIAVQAEAYREEVEIMRQDFLGTREGGGEVISTVDVPSPETFIEEEARQRDPAGFQATQVAEEFAPAFFEALGGYGGGFG